MARHTSKRRRSRRSSRVRRPRVSRRAVAIRSRSRRRYNFSKKRVAQGAAGLAAVLAASPSARKNAAALALALTHRSHRPNPNQRRAEYEGQYLYHPHNLTDADAPQRPSSVHEKVINQLQKQLDVAKNTTDRRDAKADSPWLDTLRNTAKNKIEEAQIALDKVRTTGDVDTYGILAEEAVRSATNAASDFNSLVNRLNKTEGVLTNVDDAVKSAENKVVWI